MRLDGVKCLPVLWEVGSQVEVISAISSILCALAKIQISSLQTEYHLLGNMKIFLFLKCKFLGEKLARQEGQILKVRTSSLSLEFSTVELSVFLHVQFFEDHFLYLHSYCVFVSAP